MYLHLGLSPGHRRVWGDSKAVAIMQASNCVLSCGVESALLIDHSGAHGVDGYLIRAGFLGHRGQGCFDCLVQSV